MFRSNIALRWSAASGEAGGYKHLVPPGRGTNFVQHDSVAKFDQHLIAR